MPLRSFRCPSCGAETTDLFRHDERPASPPCACGATALAIVAQTAAPVVAGRKGRREGVYVGTNPFDGAVVYESATTRIRIRGGSHDIRSADLVCTACEHTYFDALAATDPLPPCPRCGGAGREIPGIASAEHNKRFPYFDRGLGCVVKSPEHHRAICRERNLVPVEGDWDDDRHVGELAAADAKDDAEFNDYQDRLESHPAYAGWRKARDAGYLDEPDT